MAGAAAAEGAHTGTFVIMPESPNAQAVQESSLMAMRQYGDWTEYYDHRQEHNYWYNELTQETIWEDPWLAEEPVAEESEQGGAPGVMEDEVGAVRISEPEQAAYVSRCGPNKDVPHVATEVVSEVRRLPGSGRWITPLLGCCEDPSGWAGACFCPCIAYGTLVEHLSEDEKTHAAMTWTLYCVACVCPRICLEWNLRTSFREHHGIPGSDCGDLLAAICCDSCARAQMVRHMQVEELPEKPPPELWAVPDLSSFDDDADRAL